MLTELRVKNFKRFGDVTIELGDAVVFIGPNDSGKTTALQALALWDIGLKKWIGKHGSAESPKERPGVAINRQELIALPIPDAKLIWRDLHVRDVTRDREGKQTTKNVRIDILVSGVDVKDSTKWECGLEFDFTNEESLYCRPLRLEKGKKPKRIPIPKPAIGTELAFLPPMSGLADREFVKQIGEIRFLIGQGRTAEVLRNLCYQLYSGESGKDKWDFVSGRIKGLFGVQLNSPVVTERHEIIMTYETQNRVTLDLSSSGRGLQQTLLLMAFMTANPGAVLLLDEPDAHLEILRQRQIYQILTETARSSGSQVIAASHSEVVLTEAAGRDIVVAFVGPPHRIDDRGSQVLKSLREIGFDQYYQAEQTGWVLYLEGSSDLAILKAFAERLQHGARERLEQPFVYYIGNNPSKARDHFFGLREAKQDLVGYLVVDRLERPLEKHPDLVEYMWKRREIENYLCQADTLLSYAGRFGQKQAPGPLFEKVDMTECEDAMREAIDEVVPKYALRDPQSQWWIDTKASDDFMDKLFPFFFRKLGLPNLLNKTNYHQLAEFVPADLIDVEIRKVLDGIVKVSERAKPVSE